MNRDAESRRQYANSTIKAAPAWVARAIVTMSIPYKYYSRLYARPIYKPSYRYMAAARCIEARGKEYEQQRKNSKATGR